jgi:hypothetical protein
MAVRLEQMQAVVGHRFPGGTYTIENWENVLMCDATGIAPLPNGIAHPALLFHVPLAGVGTRVADIFELCHAESDEAVRAGEYRWVLHEPLRVGTTYRMSGEFLRVERKEGRRGGLMDIVTFEIELHDESETLAAAAIGSWIFLRSSD